MLDIVLAIFCSFWVFVAFDLIKEIKAVSIFEKITPKKTIIPKLSIVIAACNEELTIKDSLKTISQQKYSDIEIISVSNRN